MNTAPKLPATLTLKELLTTMLCWAL